MRVFHAVVFDSEGAEKEVRVKAFSEDALRVYMHNQGYTIKQIREELKMNLWKKLQDMEIGVRIKARNKTRLLRTLGQMIERGYVLEHIIDFLMADETSKDVLRLLYLLQKKTKTGYKDYVELFKEAEDCFDREFFSILIAGQKTGTVGRNLIDYANGKEKMLNQKGKLMKVLTGKLLILGVALVAFVVIVTIIVPQFNQLFGGALELPIGMQILIWISVFLQVYGISFFVFVVLAVIFTVGLYRFHEKIRFFIQHFLFKLPVLGSLLRMIHTRDFLYMMGNLITKGVSLMEAIRIVIEQSSNLCFRSVYEAIEKNLEKGRKLEQVLRPMDPVLLSTGLYVKVPRGYLLDSVDQAMTLGSKGGNLGEMLNEVYLTYDFQLQARMSVSIAIMGVVVSLFTYALMVFMIGSLALTLFKIMENPEALA